MNLDQYEKEKRYSPEYKAYLDDQERLGKEMSSAWKDDVAEIEKSRRVPDWYGEPRPLSKDRAALLEYLYNNGCIYWQSGPSKEKATIAKIMGYSERKVIDDYPALDLGLPTSTIAIANAKAIIDACESDGLIEQREYRGQIVYQMTTAGEYALEEWQIEKELGFL